MPTAPPKICNHPGCGALTRLAYCSRHAAEHKPKAWATTTTSAASRGYGERWRRLRLIVLARDPICRLCERAGRVSASVEVDHVRAKALGGTDDPSNLMGVCRRCHREKTVADRRAAQGRVQQRSAGEIGKARSR